MASASPDDLHWLLRTRQLVDQGDLARLSVAEIDRYRSLPGTAERWLVRRQLVTERLKSDYSQFGSRPRGA